MQFYRDQEALCFDDVLLVPQHSTVRSRSEVNLSGSILPLRVPVLSACMDTITEGKMLKSMDSFGGLGILHRYMPVADMLSILREANLEGPQCVAVGLLRRDKERIDTL